MRELLKRWFMIEEICSDFGDRFLLICLSTPNMPGIWCHASW